MSRHAFFRVLGMCALAITMLSTRSDAAWMWDVNQDKIDDRIAQVESGGALAARVGALATGRLRFALMNETAPFRYGVYVGYDHHPTDADANALVAAGVTPQVRYRSIDYIRAEITAAQAAAIAALPGVTRVETIPIMYANNDVATQTLRARDSGGPLFPNVWSTLGITGRGVTVAILDTGVNDEADPNSGYPGHESLRGKFVGGGSFFAGDPLLNTPPDSSANPAHTFDPEATYHGTHVAGSAIGSGGPHGLLGGAAAGFYGGIAPDARLVDCKVLSDAGLGFGAADAIDWMIVHRHDSWGLTGADSVFRGIDVANLSLGGSDNSDGTDASSAAVNAAARAGIVMCVATGNDGNTGYLSSPAAADLAVSVGSFRDDNTVVREDDAVSSFSNEGPRLSDGDADRIDEMKPTVMGSGTGILSALGDPTTAGDLYHHINGTSMACPTVAGVAALIRSANPGLSAEEVVRILKETAEHRRDGGKQPPSAADPFGLDPNYHPSWGWGQTDAFAAVKEALNPVTTQVVRFAVDPVRGPDAIRVRWWAQRERTLVRYRVERAADSFGAPGPWQTVHTRPVADPVSQIAGLPNRRLHEYMDLDAASAPNTQYWYRVRWEDSSGQSHAEPALAARVSESPVRARVSYAWTHDYSDGDLAVRIGTGTSTSAPIWWRAGLGASAADSVQIVPGVAYTGTRKHFFHVDLTDADLASGYLPPSSANPWFLNVKEGGYVNTNGKVDTFSVTVFGPSSSTTHTSPQTTVATVEKQETVFWIPLDPVLTPNHAPVIQSIAPQQAGEGLLMRLVVVASDPDGQPLTFTALGLPSGATFDAPAQRFEWTPGYGDAGDHVVGFVATDNALPFAAADTEWVSIHVRERDPGENLPPRFQALADQAGFVSLAMKFKVMALDPEHSSLVYAALALPSGSTLDASSGAFAWTPASPGQTELAFTVSDAGGLLDTLRVLAVVSDLQDGPLPPSPCEETVSTETGYVEAGTELATSERIIPFTAPPGIQRIEGTLTWFGGPVVDLDLHLLDADSNVVHSSASVEPSERLVYQTPVAGTYYWRVVGYTTPDTAEFAIESKRCTTPVTAVDSPDDASLRFAPPAPNPFRGSTRLHFTLPASAHASLAVFDISGRRVRTILDGRLEAGVHSRLWDGRSESGGRLRAGIYFARLRVDGAESQTRRLILMP